MEHFAIFKTVKISLNWNAHLIGTLWICREIIHLNGTPVYFLKKKSVFFSSISKNISKTKCSKSKGNQSKRTKKTHFFACGALVAWQKHTICTVSSWNILTPNACTFNWFKEKTFRVPALFSNLMILDSKRTKQLNIFYL